MKYGYARTSTDDQTNAMQLAALKKFGCTKILESSSSAYALPPS
jgi:DNA invertase Pin-like site-specific DNA recombinase